MSNNRLIDPELQSSLQFFSGVAVSNESLAAARRNLADVIAQIPISTIAGVTREKRSLPVPLDRPPVMVTIYRPNSLGESVALLPAVLHIHGGGYVMGSADMDDEANKKIAAEMPCVVVSVDYRLAPETSHPGPVEDCYTALEWLHQESLSLGVDRTRIAVKGESAGGGLAASLALLARDRGDISICFQQLIFPMLDDRTCKAIDPHPHVGQFVWTPADNVFGWSSLLGESPGGPSISEYASPSRALDLRGLPSTFISVGALDLFLEEDMDYARRLTRAEVPTEFHLYPAAYHGFYLAATARTTIAAVADIHRALRRALYG